MGGWRRDSMKLDDIMLVGMADNNSYFYCRREYFAICCILFRFCACRISGILPSWFTGIAINPLPVNQRWTVDHMNPPVAPFTDMD